MIIEIPDILTPELIQHFREQLDATSWVDGRVTAGNQAGKIKQNLQLPTDNPVGIQLGEIITRALSTNPLFMTAALPLRVLPPMFNKYTGGGTFGQHIDNAIRYIPGTSQPMRTDLSATLFLNHPEEYDGGILTIEDTYGTKEVKLPAGHMILYPSTSLHHVTPVTRGARVCSFFWIQSMVRDNTKRELLFDLDCTIQRLTQDHGDLASVEHNCVHLTGIYHNLIRQWTEL